MKKWLILLGVVAVVAGIYYVARQQRYEPPWAQPKFGKVTRGDIRVPITAAGLIRANQEVELKSKASGRIIQVPVVEGMFVKVGQPVAQLDPDDEQRRLDRAQADFDRAEALLTQAKVAVERAAVSIESAKARAEEISAQGEIAKFELQKVEELAARGQASAQQLNDARAQYRMSLAQQESARIAITSAELAKQDAETAVASQQAVVNSARKTLEDSVQRVKETTVLAPVDAIVTEVFVKPGVLVQSATEGFTGGTPVMRLADVSKKMVVARLDEADYGRVLNISPLDALPDMPQLREAAAQDAEQLAQRSGIVTLMVDAFKDDTFTGRIVRVEPQGKLNAGSSIIQFDVHVEITDEKRHKLPLGAQAQVEFTVESAIATLRVPAEAVKTFEGQKGVYLKTPPSAGSNERYSKKFVPCRFGISDGEYTQVISVLADGRLNEGDEVFTKLPEEPGERR